MIGAAEHASIDGPAGKLELLIDDAPAGTDARFAVLCHPHPLYGGTMDNKVVTTLARAMRDAAIPSLRFNFRGVGQSAGAFDNGLGETADADAAALYGETLWPGRRLVLAGFSFGAYVALNLAQRRDVALLVTIAPPVDLFDFSTLGVPDCPWLVLQGDADDVVDPRHVEDWIRHLSPQPRLAILPGAGHFFHGRLNEVRSAVIDFVRGG